MKRIALVAAVGLVLAGCGGSRNANPTPQQPRYPTVVHFPALFAASPGLVLRGGARLVSPTRLAIATVGSSSCPSVPDELVVESRSSVRLHLVTGSWSGRRPVAHPPASGICTADLGTTVMLVAIDPTLVDVHRTVTVGIVYRDGKKPEVRTAAPLKS